MDGASTADEIRKCLLEFYPDLVAEDDVTVVVFEKE